MLFRCVPFHGGVMRRVGGAFFVAFLCTAAAALTNCNRSQPARTTEASASGNRAIAPAAASPADDGNWVMPGKDYASTRFSALKQITPTNVGNLSLAFTFSTATTKGFEAPPLVVNGTMYIITPFPNLPYALDLTKPGAPAK